MIRNKMIIIDDFSQIMVKEKIATLGVELFWHNCGYLCFVCYLEIVHGYIHVYDASLMLL